MQHLILGREATLFRRFQPGEVNIPGQSLDGKRLSILITLEPLDTLRCERFQGFVQVGKTLLRFLSHHLAENGDQMKR